MGGVEIDRADRAENKVQDRKRVTVCRFLQTKYFIERN